MATVFHIRFYLMLLQTISGMFTPLDQSGRDPTVPYLKAAKEAVVDHGGLLLAMLRN